MNKQVNTQKASALAVMYVYTVDFMGSEAIFVFYQVISSLARFYINQSYVASSLVRL